eukprot:Pgem_evm1s3947
MYLQPIPYCENCNSNIANICKERERRSSETGQLSDKSIRIQYSISDMKDIFLKISNIKDKECRGIFTFCRFSDGVAIETASETMKKYQIFY